MWPFSVLAKETMNCSVGCFERKKSYNRCGHVWTHRSCSHRGGPSKNKVISPLILVFGEGDHEHEQWPLGEEKIIDPYAAQFRTHQSFEGLSTNSGTPVI
jgi:hypothetical protein